MAKEPGTGNHGENEMNDQPARTGDPAAHGPIGTPLNESVASSSQRIELIIEAAEKAAAGIIADAEAQARSYLEQSRVRADQIATERSAGLSELADSLMTRAESVKQQSADLIEALEAARAQIAARLSEDVTIPPLADTPAAQEAAEPGQDAAPRLAPVAPVERGGRGGFRRSLPPSPRSKSPSPTLRTTRRRSQTRAGGRGALPRAAPSPPASPPSAGARLLATQMAVAGSSREEIASRLENEFGIADPDAMLDGILGPRG